MSKKLMAVLTLATFVVTGFGIVAVAAEKPKYGGTLKAYHRGTPPSMSIHEEATVSTNYPAMPIMNNLVLFDYFNEVESLKSVKGELASSWKWSKDRKKLTFNLRKGVKWHDGKPFTSKDVKYTWELILGKTEQSLRKNPRKVWYKFLESVTTNGDYSVTFNLNRPQPSFLVLLASGYSPVYPAHVDPKDMRTNPIGTGPFKFVELKQNESIKLVKNKDYYRKGRPYMDGIDTTIIKNTATRVLALAAGTFDLSFPWDVNVPLEREVRAQAPKIISKLRFSNVSTNLIVNFDSPPFNDPEIRQVLALSIDRQAFIDSLSEGKTIMGGAMLPPPAGVWGLSKKQLNKVIGYGSVEKNRDRARAIMKKKGYSESNPLKVIISTRNIAIYRDPAAILIAHLKQVFVEAELKTIETSNWHATVARKDYQVGLNLTGVGVDDPDANFFENYSCGSQRNYAGYCNPELDKLFEKQSAITNFKKRLALVQEIDRKLQEDGARPLIFHNASYTSWWPHVKNMVVHNNTYNSWRMDEVWLDR